METISWWKLVPDIDHRFVIDGFGTWKGADYATAALGSDGSCGLVYLPSRRTFTVDRAHLNVGTHAHWFDPTDGRFLPADGRRDENARERFMSPDQNAAGGQDWVLVFRAS